MKKLTTTFAIGFACLAISLTGCKPAPTADSGAADAHQGEAAHAHPTEGPHHGSLIELGNEEYHAELVHDDAAGTVTIYVLDSAATAQVPIVATEITINATHDGMPEQFLLAASPDENDPEGQSSRFVSTDKELAAHLDEEGAEPRLVLSINGKSYRGTIHHDHDGEGHHDHGH
ncbi:hypothetical protein [Rosistilla oblonga]|uniref:hypothetical protein n=1 Tax=Rosistilla oblonga TaxID=2527990 RepID=UPI003A981DE8